MLFPAAAEKIVHMQMQPLTYTRREMVRLLRIIGHGTLPEILPQVLFQILAVEQDAPAPGNLVHQRKEPCIQFLLCRFISMLYFYNNILQSFHILLAQHYETSSSLQMIFLYLYCFQLYLLIPHNFDLLQM